MSTTMNLLLKCRSAISIVLVNSIFLISIGYYGYFSYDEYQQILKYQTTPAAAADNSKYNDIAYALRTTLNSILISNPSVIIESQDFKIIGEYNKDTIIGELTLEFEDGYLNLIDLLGLLDESKIIGRIAYLKLAKNTFNTLNIGLKAHSLLDKE